MTVESTDDLRELQRRRGERQLALIWGGFAALAIALSPLAGRLATGLPACPFKALTAQPCPGCGTTRAALALARFDLGTAWAVSPLATVAWVWVIAGGLAAAMWVLMGKQLPQLPMQWPWSVRIALVLAVLGNWVYLVLHGS